MLLPVTLLNDNEVFNLLPLKTIKPSVGFTDKNSVLTFESPPNDGIISLGDELPLNNLGFEDLDLSKGSEPIKLDFEEL